jgi:hypothetical protein
MLNALRFMKAIIGQLALTQQHFSLLRGVDETTTSRQMNGGVIPETAGDWLRRVVEIKTYPGGAVIYLDMPRKTAIGHYMRRTVENEQTPARGNTPSRRKSLP